VIVLVFQLLLFHLLTCSTAHLLYRPSGDSPVSKPPRHSRRDSRASGCPAATV